MTLDVDLASLEQDFAGALGYVRSHAIELGHILPPTEKIFKEYFPPEQSFISRRNKKITGVFSYRSGRDKHAPTGDFRIIADSLNVLKMIIKEIEKTALSGEKTVLRTSLFSYETKKIRHLNSLGYRIGASLPGLVSYNGRRYDYNYLYKDLTEQYSFDIRRSYAKPGLYPLVELEKAKDHKLRTRGYRKEDRQILDAIATHHMVIRGIGGGVFEGLLPWMPGFYDTMVEAGRTVPIVCEDETIHEPVGIIDLWRLPQEVMRHSALTGMYVKAGYQGIGVGTLLMDSMKILAKRMHLTRVWLSVFEGNTPANRLYRKQGFEECGKIPGWLQEGYINEIFMVLKLD